MNTGEFYSFGLKNTIKTNVFVFKIKKPEQKVRPRISYFLCGV